MVDEHTLEARLLKGIVRAGDDVGLVLDDPVVARGSQFPTLWGHGGPARYLDAMLRRGTTPLAIELKVATGGQGRYYRRALVQAVLYRHFIVNAPGLDPWFDAAGLDRRATEASIGIPIPRRWTSTFDRSLNLLHATAARVGATVRRPRRPSHPRLDRARTLARAGARSSTKLSPGDSPAHSRPDGHGRSVRSSSSTPPGSTTNSISSRPLSGRSARPSSPLTVRLNRAGSLWVFGPSGRPRWTWRGVWNHLAASGDVHEAARIVGAIAGLGRPEPAPKPTFPQLAAAFLDRLGSHRWTWRNAAPDAGTTSEWVERYRSQTKRYGRTAPDGKIPPITRIWGAIDESGEAAVIVDQRNLRVWAWSDNQCIEQTAGDPFRRIADAADIVADTNTSS